MVDSGRLDHEEGTSEGTSSSSGSARRVACCSGSFLDDQSGASFILSDLLICFVMGLVLNP